MQHLLLVDANSSDANRSDSNKSKPFNVDIDSLKSHIVYHIKEGSLKAKSSLLVSTPYAKDISLSNDFEMTKDISFSGELKAPKLEGLDAEMVKPLSNLHIVYKGDLSTIKTTITSDGLKGSFNSADMKKGLFHLETKTPIALGKMVTLPKELNASKVNAVIDVPVDFAKITPIKANVKILSNVSNIDAEISYGTALKAKITTRVPKDSLLIGFNDKVKWSAISPLVANIDLGEKEAKISLASKVLSADLKYALKSADVDGLIKLSGLQSTIKGNANKKIEIQSSVHSIESLMQNLQTIYTMEGVPPIEGALNLSVDITELKEADIKLTSPKIIFHADRETDHFIDDVSLVVSLNKSQVQLKSYQVVYDKMKIFSTKPSVVNMKNDTIEIVELWLNDQLKVTGNYDLKTMSGSISADTDKLHIAHEIIDLDTAIAIKTDLNQEKTAVNGDVVILGGNIHYDLSKKTFAKDSDIIIVQDMKKEEESPFMDNLSVFVKVTTKSPLVYNKDAINVKANVNLDIHKSEHSDLMVLGSVDLLDGGSYMFQNKKFVLEKSHVYFTGDPNKPMLDITVNYQALNHLITIGVTGTPEIPNITFSSVPSLNKEQILSLILFDSEEGAGTNSGDEMMKMMGGAMAKSVLSNMGIQLDHLTLGTGGEFEVGKKLTKKITIIYVNDEVSAVKLKYRHSPRTESVLSASEESESYDIVYKNDYSDDDIIFFKKKK